MDRYCRSFRESIYNNKNSNNNNNNISSNSSLKDPWSYDDRSYLVGGDPFSGSFLGGFSWPPRSYSCSFCKREFRSAQALGGHMNVHRRDRARLRESSPWDAPTSSPEPNPNPNPNPNPEDNIVEVSVPNLNHAPEPVSEGTFSPPCPPGRVPQANYTFPHVLSPVTQFTPSPSFVSSRPNFYSSSHDISKPRKTMKPLFEVGEMGSVEGKGDHPLRRKRDIVKLDLKIGIHGDGRDDSGEDLDLELRLGYA